eukprot:9373473-Ditylum_brightwellii.AAC.1
MKLQQPLGTWFMKQPYITRQTYDDPDAVAIYELCDRIFHASKQMFTDLLYSAIFLSVRKFGHLCYCKEPLLDIQQQVETKVEVASQNASTFAKYLTQQPEH